MTAAAAGAHPPTGRIALIDALRAFALFGILQINIQSYLWGPGATVTFAQPPSLLDQAVIWLLLTFVATKFLSLFAFLFGYGFALQLKSLRRRLSAVDARRAYRRRLVFLLVLGVLHGSLLYFGDILTAYALCGFALLLYAQSRPRVLVSHAIGWQVANVVLLVLTSIGAHLVGQSVPAEQAAQVPPEWYERFALAAAGSFADHLAVTVTGYIDLVPLTLTFAAPYVIGLFVLGALAGRLGWLAHPERHPKVWQRARMIGLATLPLAAVGAWLSLQGYRESPGVPSALGFVLTTSSFPVMALYLAWIVAHRDAPWMRRALHWLAPAGRMPLTNYLVQSVLMGVLLSGWGLGWGVDLGVTDLALLGFVIVALQLVASRAWIARFGQGPVEALWKRATYRGGNA